MSAYLKTLTLGLISVLVSASPATGQLLPPEILQCIEDGVCTEPVPLGTLDNTGAVSGFTYVDSGVEKVLMRYEVLATNETLFNETNSVETFREILWLSAQQQYDVNSSNFHQMELFTADNGSFFSTLLFNFDPNRVVFATDGLLQGTGDTGLVGDFENPPPGLPPTLLEFPLNVCLSQECFGQASLNLVGLEYANIGGVARFNPQPITSLSDDLLFTRIRGFPGLDDQADSGAFDETLTVRLSATAVPEPNAVFAVLVCGVLVSLKRRR